MLTLAIDLDEVLGEFIVALSSFHNEQYGSNLSVGSFHSYVFRDVWGGTEEESAKKVHSFFKSDHFKNIPVVPGAQAALAQLRSKFRLVCVTSRQHVIEDDTRAWLDMHFPEVFSDVVFGNHWGRQGEKRSKPDLCRDVDACALIDDSALYAEQCAKEGIPVILFDLQGNYGWNKCFDETAMTLVTRVKSWDDVVHTCMSTSFPPQQQSPAQDAAT